MNPNGVVEPGAGASGPRRGVGGPSSARAGLERVREGRLELQVLLDRHGPADLRDGGDLATLGLEDGEQPGLLRQPGDANARGRLAAEAERAGDEDMDVAG